MGVQAGVLRNAFMTYAVSSADLALLVVMNLLVPLFATKEDFGEYRLLILYSGYAGILHFGLLNGLYLNLVGKPLGEDQVSVAAAIRRVLLILQLIILPAALLGVYGILGSSVSIVPLLGIGLAWLSTNIVTFHNYVLQATGNFGPYAKVNLIARVFGFVFLGVMMASGSVVVDFLALSFVAPLLACAAIYELTWRKTCRVNYVCSVPLKQVWTRGVVLYLGNIGISLLFTADKLCLSWSVNRETFARYALAFMLTNVLTSLTEALVTALIPQLASRARSARNEWVTTGVQAILVWSGGAAFWVASWIMATFYPTYRGLSGTLLALSAAAPFSIFIRLVLSARAVAYGKETILLRFAIVSASAAILIVMAALYLNRSLEVVALAWSAAIGSSATLGWIYMRKKLLIGFDGDRLFWAAALSTLALIFCGTCLRGWPALVSYLCLATVVVLKCIRCNQVNPLAA